MSEYIKIDDLMIGGLPMAVIDLGDVEIMASDEELLRLVECARIDLNKY